MTEAYWGGVISQRNGVALQLGNYTNQSYRDAHNFAIPQSGRIELKTYNKDGRRVHEKSSTVHRVEWLVFPNRQEPIVVMRLP